MAKDLTAREVLAISRPGQHRVGANLYIRVKPGGGRSWLFRYMRGGRPHWMGLGPVELVPLAEARAKTLGYRRRLYDGGDPLVDARAARIKATADSLTFAVCAQRYIAAHESGWRNGKHRNQWRTSLGTYVLPVIGNLPVKAVDTPAVMRVLGPIWQAKAETASRVRGRIESVLDWAATAGYRQGDNPARWRGHLENLLPGRKKVAPVEHHAAMPYTDLPGFMVALRNEDGIPARALELLVLTATRTGEVLKARWAEIDLGARIWTIPASRMKSGKPHTVPLSDRPTTLLSALPRSGELLFEGRARGRPPGSMALPSVLARLGCTATVHGFRSTFRDWAAEQTHHPNHVVEMALAHAIGNGVEAAYRRGDLLAKRRELMQDWAAYCGG